MILMSGKVLREKKLKELKEKVQRLSSKPGIGIIQINPSVESDIYTKSKINLANSLGYNYKKVVMLGDVTETELIKQINIFNSNDEIDGIIVDMPLPKYMDKAKVLNSIDSSKDIDGVNYQNLGKLVSGQYRFIPSTPKSIIDLLDYYSIPFIGENVVVIGRSLIVGKPIANIFTNRDATVTLCHSKTTDLKYYTNNADIVVVAVGKKHFLTADMVSSGVVVVDVGINSENGKIYGDVDFLEVSKKAGYITPVPGGVGPLTVCELMENTYSSHVLRLEKKNK